MRSELLEELSDRTPGPAASSGAAATVAIAAALVVRAARESGGWADAPGIAAQALRLRARAEALVDEAARAYAAAAEALRDRPGDATLMMRLEAAALAPLDVGRTAADVALLAAAAALEAADPARPDAVAAAALAAGAARAAETIVAVNLGVTPGDPRRAAAREHRVAAERAAMQAEAGLSGS
jgi:formiminotetrahydrofolate cyclodeaminase